MLKSKICKNCQQEFQTDYNEQFCSDECRKEFRAKYSAEYMRIRRRNASGVKDFGVALEKRIVNGVMDNIYNAFMKGKLTYEILEQFLNIEDPREAIRKWYEMRDELKNEEDPPKGNASVKNKSQKTPKEIQESQENASQVEETNVIELISNKSAPSVNPFLAPNEFKVESITKTIHTNRTVAPCSLCFKDLKQASTPFYVFKILTHDGTEEELLCSECFTKRYPEGIIDKYPYDTYLVPARRESISKFLQEDTIPYQVILDYLNKRTKRDFRLTEKHRELIKARWNECLALGLTPEQTLQRFKKVIDIKRDSWGIGEMSKYLRPITLFGTKFESYANEKTDDEWKQIRKDWGWDKEEEIK